LKPSDVIEQYDKKDVREQVDAMDEEEISDFAARVAALASTIEDPPDAIAKRVVAFFEQEKISPEVRIFGIRTLTANMRGKLVSEKLAYLLAADLDKLPMSFWEKDYEDGLIRVIDVCNELGRLRKYVMRTDISNRVRKAAAMKASRVAPAKEDKAKFLSMADGFAQEDGDEELVTEIDSCDDIAGLIRYVRRTDISKRVRRMAALKVARITTKADLRRRYLRIVDDFTKGGKLIETQ